MLDSRWRSRVLLATAEILNPEVPALTLKGKNVDHVASTLGLLL